MFPISNETLQLLKNGAMQEASITMALANGDTLTLDNNDIVRGSLVVDRYVCEEKLTLGNAVASELSFTLVNNNNVYEGVNFEKAIITLNLVVGSSTIKMGKFICEKPTQLATTIKIYALDFMTKLDVICPTNIIETDEDTPLTLIQKIVTTFSLEGYVVDSNLANRQTTIAEESGITLPTNCTYRKLVQMIAEFLGGNAYFDYNNYLHFSNYSNDSVISLTPNDRYSSNYSSASTIDGVKVINLDHTYVAPSVGSSDSYVSGTTFHLGTGASVVNQKLTFSSLFKNSISIQYKKAVFGGFNQRPFTITDNALIRNQTQVNNIYSASVGNNVLTYVPFSATTKPMPYAYPMDRIEFTTKEGNIFYSIITHIKFVVNKNTLVESCGKSDYQEDTNDIVNSYITNEELNKSGTTSNKIVTTITEDTIKTTNVIAEYLRVRVANIIGTITANAILVKDSISQTIFSADSDNKSVTMDLSKITISGVATFKSSNDIISKNDNISELTNNSGYQDSNGVTTIIGSTVTASFVNALNITANEILVKDNNNNVILSANATNKTVTMDLSKMTVNGVATFITSNDIITEGDNISELVNNSGYQNATQVDNLITAKGYQDSTGVTTIIGNTVNTGFVNALGITAKEINVVDMDADETIFHAYAGTGEGDDDSFCKIGGFTVDYVSITANTNQVGIRSDEVQVASLVTNGNSHLRFFAGNSGTISQSRFMVLQDGSVYCSAIKITGGAIQGTTILLEDTIGTSVIGGTIKIKTNINFDELQLFRPIKQRVGQGQVEYPLYLSPYTFRYQNEDYVLCIKFLKQVPSPTTTRELTLNDHFEVTIMKKSVWATVGEWNNYSYDDDIDDYYQ